MSSSEPKGVVGSCMGLSGGVVPVKRLGRREKRAFGLAHGFCPFGSVALSSRVRGTKLIV